MTLVTVIAVSFTTYCWPLIDWQYVENRNIKETTGEKRNRNKKRKRPFLGHLRREIRCPSVRPHFFRLVSMKLGMWVEVDEWCTTLFHCPQSRSRPKGFVNCQIWPHARLIGSERMNGSKWMFPYSECLGPSPRRNGGGILDSAPGVRSRDTELWIFG